MTAHLSNGSGGASSGGVTLEELPKTSSFTSKLPQDPAFPTPLDSHNAPRDKLGPRLVKGSMYTYVRPERQEEPELLAVSPTALADIGLKAGEEQTEEFKELVAGNRLLSWDESTGEGIYPWAQCYGGWQFGSWAGQLGDGRAISLFEATNPNTHTRHEIQLKGAGRTPYSRFADGKAVLRSSIREFIVSEALNALKIPSTRALSLTLLPHSRVQRERSEPGAIVARFAQSWLRIGSFDLIRSRGDRNLLRQLADYVAVECFGGWDKLPSVHPTSEQNLAAEPPTGIPESQTTGSGEEADNRYARLYRAIVRRNALTVAKWQAYGFMNGVLNTDNTSLIGLSIDFGPFAFMDDFDPTYTPNHDDHSLRYNYRNQPTIIWWNLVRLGEDLGELLGAGDRVDDQEFVEKGVREEVAPELVKCAEHVIDTAGDEYRAVFMAEYKRLMSARLGLKTQKESDFESLYSELLDTMEALALDFNQFFRKLSSVRLAEVATEEGRIDVAARFFHHEGVTGIGYKEDTARERVAAWLERWRARIIEDRGENSEEIDAQRSKEMKAVNPKFIPKSWVLDELIQRVEKGGEREVLERVLDMALRPFEDSWYEGSDKEASEKWRAEEERFCGDVPKTERAMQCSCSS
ncbi:MAG: hypothetical protein M4579_002375 [Chaenotheca gracillima]|nr:MAG: hypothetical protein M4579_002375 [Chaenotheca gracillima]